MRAVPTAYCLQIKAFKHLLERDESENKEVAQKELAYVYHTVDPTSSYSSYGEDTRKEKVKEGIFGTSTDWVEDAYVREAMEVYEELNLSEAERLLQSAKKSAKSLREYFEKVDLTERDERGKPIHKAKDLISNLSNVGQVVEGIKELEEQVKKEQSDYGNIRGGVELTKYSK